MFQKSNGDGSYMNIFLAYASLDKTTAESVAFSLRSRGHKVFLDRDDLPPGRSYDQQIERAIKGCDIFVFLISPDSVAEGRYTLAELAFARQKWLHPDGRVLPIMTRKTPLEQVPPYLKAATILEPAGNIAAETGAAVDAMFNRSDKLRESWMLRAALIAACAIAALLACESPCRSIIRRTRQSHQALTNWRPTQCCGGPRSFGFTRAMPRFDDHFFRGRKSAGLGAVVWRSRSTRRAFIVRQFGGGKSSPSPVSLGL
jgi:hypothetical protein